MTGIFSVLSVRFPLAFGTILFPPPNKITKCSPYSIEINLLNGVTLQPSIFSIYSTLIPTLVPRKDMLGSRHASIKVGTPKTSLYDRACYARDGCFRLSRLSVGSSSEWSIEETIDLPSHPIRLLV